VGLAHHRGSAQTVMLSSALAAPLMHIRFEMRADVAGRYNSGAKQIGDRKSAPQGNQKRASNLGVM